VAKVVTCPSCQARGGIPDDAQVARIRCPKCGTVYKVGTDAAAGTAAPPPIAQVSRSGSALVPAPPPTGPPLARPGAAGAPSVANNRIMLFALLGVSGLVVVLIGVILVLVLGGGRQNGGAAPGTGENGPLAAYPQATPAGSAVAATVPPSELMPPVSTSPAAVATTSSTKVAVNAISAGSPEPTAAVAATPAASIPDRAAPPEPQEILRRLKDATVLINTKIGKRTIGNGSGFVIEVDGSKVIVATNRHVAVTDVSDLPPGLLPKGETPSLEAVFRSGSGKDEQALPAQIIAADLSGDLSTDLAFLVVQGVSNPPRPIDPFSRFEPIDGMSYLGAGFPLAGVIKISENEGKPSVVFTGGRISTPRRDEFGQLLVYQVDGSLQPGNSGGPIIDERSGKLIGLAVAKASNVDTIGFVVPAEQLRRALGGRVGGLSLTLEKSDPGKANLTVKANLVDPKLQVAGVEVRAAALSSVGKLSPNSDGSWPALPNAQPVQLQRNPRAPSATGRVEVALAGSGANGRKVLVQAAHRDMRGRTIYSRPREVFIPDSPGPIRDSGSMRKIAGQVMAKSLALLGALVDPSKDCRLDKDDRSYKVRIDIPGKMHTISPAFLRTKNTPMHNAPMALADVDGDFMAQVSVTGEMNPGAKLPGDRAARDLGYTFQSGGLVLYQDKNNFLRLERMASIVTARLTPMHRILVEAVRDGQHAIVPIWLDVPEGDTKLILIRRKGRIRCLFVPNGSNSLHTFREFALSFPTKVKVGLVASNISAQSFSATFQGFALISDATQIDRELEDE
jgi:regulation of enolase protein 1 (concanavalin A-like superfamily)